MMIQAACVSKPLRALHSAPSQTSAGLDSAITTNGNVALPRPMLQYRNQLSYILARIAHNYDCGGFVSVMRYGACYIMGKGRNLQ